MNQTIENIIASRNITSLVHFTRVENLDQILNNGVVPRQSLSSETALFNDNVRADGKLNYSSFSISFPNHKMFYRLRCNNPDTKWAILVLKSDLLIDYDCLFYPINAATSSVSRQPIENFKGAVALENMFTHSPDTRENFLRLCDPTDVQAEVLIPDVITADFFKGCVLSDVDLVKCYSKKYPHIKFIHCHMGRRIFHTRKAFLNGF